MKENRPLKALAIIGFTLTPLYAMSAFKECTHEYNSVIIYTYDIVLVTQECPPIPEEHPYFTPQEKLLPENQTEKDHSADDPSCIKGSILVDL